MRVKTYLILNIQRVWSSMFEQWCSIQWWLWWAACQCWTLFVVVRWTNFLCWFIQISFLLNSPAKGEQRTKPFLTLARDDSNFRPCRWIYFHRGREIWIFYLINRPVSKHEITHRTWNRNLILCIINALWFIAMCLCGWGNGGTTNLRLPFPW